VQWSRPRLDDEAGYELTLELLDGHVTGGGGAPLVISADRDGAPLRIRITALTGERPLVPLRADALFSNAAGSDQRGREALEFLSYEEKFLAGSWRFDTYFGRDTLMSLRLLMPALRPDAIEAGLASVLERLDRNGEVAHEEDIGEFAVLRRRKEGIAGNDPAAPIYDYKMIDDDVMLAPVAATWLLDGPEGRARAGAFLARKTPAGEPLGAALARNFAFVVGMAQPFAREPAARNLVALKPGHTVGQWRDSDTGLGGGRIPYDVNAVFVPAALEAIARFSDAQLLQGHANTEQQQVLATARGLAEVWSTRAPSLFQFNVDAGAARAAVARYANAHGIDPAPALASVAETGIRFPALALDAGGRPIPVLHSDGGFALLFRDPEPQELDALVEAMLRPFPAGLLTDAGLLVANPAYADSGVGADFGRTAYHGTVVWSWQQALLAAGLARQLQRNDLPEESRARLRDAQRRLWQAIDSTGTMRTSELWSWAYAEGRYRAVPFGQSSGDADESNAAQLWSTVYLAIPPPADSDSEAGRTEAPAPAP
jgi:glycogen debranching enzyme